MPNSPQAIGDMLKKTYDPDEDGAIALAQLVAAVCSEAEADGKITTHKGDASAHHAKTGDNEVYGLVQAGTDAGKPAAGTAGRWYFATDTLILSRDNGTAWVEMARGETAIRLAQLSEKAHSSLTGIGASDHHAKTGDNEVKGLVLVDLAANRPAAGIAGRWFIASDTLAISYDNGTAWATVGTLGGQDVSDYATHKATAAAHHAKTTAASEITSGRFGMARMPDGTSGYYLKAQGAGVDPVYATVSGGYTEGARVYNNANLSISSGVWTILTFNSERYDTDAIHSTASNTSRLTCKTAGKYIIIFHGRFAADVNGRRRARIILNGTTHIDYWSEDAPANGVDLDFGLATIYDLSVNDYVEVAVFENIGAALNIMSAAENTPEFMMQRIG